jgi:type II secretory pathway pseudopilin PulG
MLKKRGQVWVETAIYTLIGLTIIAILLAIANPQIEKTKDRGVITQTAEAMETIDNKLLEVEQAPGSTRVVDLKISKGKLEILSSNDSIRYILENTRLKMSEPGVEIKEGSFVLQTLEYGKRYHVIITRNYSSNLNISYNGREENKAIQAASTPYQLRIENKGNNDPANPGEKSNIEFSLL